MNDFKNLRAFAATFICLVGFGCNCGDVRQNWESEKLADQLKSIEFRSENDVQNALSNAVACECAVVFVHLDWAPMPTDRFAEFALAHQESHLPEDIAFHYIDFTSSSEDYQPLRSLAGWSELEEATGTSLVHGKGELVWLNHGRVVHVQSITSFDSVSEFLAKATSLMP